jgi:hypothetical protein
MIAWLAALPRKQAAGAFGAKASHQSLNLAGRQVQPLRCQARLQIAVHDSLDYFDPIQLAHAHRNHPGIGHDGLLGKEPLACAER